MWLCIKIERKGREGSRGGFIENAPFCSSVTTEKRERLTVAGIDSAR